MNVSPQSGRRRVVRLTRFEKKILAALLAVGFLPLVAALLLGLGALREAYSVGVNKRVTDQLRYGLDVQKKYIASLREMAKLRVENLAFDPKLQRLIDSADSQHIRSYLDQAVAEQPDLVSAVICGEGSCNRPRASEHDPEFRYLELERSVGDTHTLHAIVRAPWRPFREHQASAQTVKTFETLYEGQSSVTMTYLGVYMALLLSVICVVVAVGIILSRRVTRRVALLAEATEQVGSGSLDVSLPVEASDEIAELTRAFNKMVEDLRNSRSRIEDLQRIGAWQQFARRLAHEIKNPLTPIQLAIQEVEKGYRGENAVYRRQLEQSREIIVEEVNTLRRLVSEFSNFARLPTATLEQENLSSIFEDLRRNTDALIQDDEAATDEPARVHFEWDVAVSLPARVDAMMFRRCVDNLVRNAVQALRGREGTIVVSAYIVDDVVRIDVSDDGPGVRPEDRPQLFTPYFTRKSDGTGLGLAIVKKIVLEHEGSISYVAGERGGATFRIELPLHGPSARAGGKKGGLTS